MTTAVLNVNYSNKLDLDILAGMSVDALNSLYRGATLPRSFTLLDGKHEGRVLAIRIIEKTPVFGLIRRFSRAKSFPWDGKSFRSLSDNEGTGINRINLMVAQQSWFPFKTSIEKSVIDGGDCIYLDYGLPKNPWFIRKIRDELREVSSGLFLGPAMWKNNQGGAALLLWFALDTGKK